MAKKDFYETLGITKSASADEIKKAYRKMAMKFHPDQNPNNKLAEEKFKQVTEAYEVLSDEKKRAAYDQFGHAGANGFSGFGNAGAGAGAGGFRGGFGGPNQGPGGFGGQDPFQDIFGEIFGDVFGGKQGPGAGRSARKTKGSDLRYSLTVSMEEAGQGCEKQIHFMRIRNDKEESAKLMVTVPAGVKSGQRLKLREEGDGGLSGGPSGDLYVVISIQDHPLFVREENDCILELPITFTDAILGATVEIPNLTGKTQLKIPAGAHSGQVFRLKGKGFSKVGGFGVGDMLVKIVVDTPTTLTSEQKDLIEKLSKSLSETPQVKKFKEKVDAYLRTRK